MKRVLLWGVVALILAAAPMILAAGGLDLSWHVFSGGGGPAAAGSFTLHSSVGQALAGVVQADAFAACAGFWCRPLLVHDLFLPLILR